MKYKKGTIVYVPGYTGCWVIIGNTSTDYITVKIREDGSIGKDIILYADYIDSLPLLVSDILTDV